MLEKEKELDLAVQQLQMYEGYGEPLQNAWPKWFAKSCIRLKCMKPTRATLRKIHVIIVTNVNTKTK